MQLDAPMRTALARLRSLALAAAAALLALAQRAFGQAQEPEAPSGAGFFSIGVRHADIGDLNRQLEAAGCPAFDRTMLAIGGGGHTVRDGGVMLGGGGMRMAIGPQAVPDSFDDVLEDPDRQVAMHRGRLLLSLGGGLEHRFGEEPGGLTLGLRAGYVVEPYSAAWRMDGSVVSDGPDAATTGPFVRVTLGRWK